MSRMAYLFTTNNEEDINILTRKTFSLFALISLPCIFVLIGINKYFTPAFFGEEYTSSVSMIYILALGIFFSSFSDLVVLSLCFVPRGHFWKRTIIYFCIDLFECICVPICVRFLKGNGAALGLLLTQIATALTCFLFSRKEVDYKLFVKPFFKCLLASIIMFGCIFGLGFLLQNKIGYLYISIIQVIVGIIIYGVLVILFKEELVMSYINKIFKKKA